MKRNTEAITKLRDQLLFEPEKHDQSSWGALTEPRKAVGAEVHDLPPNDIWCRRDRVAVSCATSACAAGWTVIQAGDMMLYDPDLVREGYAEASECMDRTGKVRSIYNRAKKVLGLTDRQADIFFDGDWTNGQTIQLAEVLMKDDLSNKEVTAELNRLSDKFNGY